MMLHTVSISIPTQVIWIDIESGNFFKLLLLSLVEHTFLTHFDGYYIAASWVYTLKAVILAQWGGGGTTTSNPKTLGSNPGRQANDFFQYKNVYIHCKLTIGQKCSKRYRKTM